MTPQKANYPQGALAYIKRFWFDTALSGHPAPLDALRAFADPARILFGTDYPYVSEDVANAETAGLDAYTGFSEAERKMVARGNAEALFPRLR